MSSVWKKEMKNFFVHHECDCTCWLYYGKQQQNAVKYTGIVLIFTTVALALRVHTVCLAFENLFVLISSKLHSKRVIIYTNGRENYFNKFHLE